MEIEEAINSNKLEFLSKGVQMRKEENVGCEDFFMTCPRALGVCDGVSQWRNEFGISAGDFAEELMTFSKLILEEKLNRNDMAPLHPQEILSKALDNSTSFGSATTLLCSLNESKLHVTYIGDCKLQLYRDKGSTVALIKETENYDIQTNSPSQIAKVPTDVQMNKLLLENKITQHNLTIMRKALNASKDLLQEDFLFSESKDYEVKENDIVIMGSDGFFDNISNYAIRRKILKHLQQRKNGEITQDQFPSILANILLQKALKNSIEEPKLVVSPNKLSKIKIGGKKDDITILVGLIVKSP